MNITGVKIVDNTLNYLKALEKANDRALNVMAVDVERLAKAQVPFNKGQLKASGAHQKVGKKWRVIFNKEYAAYQEWGGATDKNGVTRIVKKYSRPGKGKFYLRDPVILVQSKGANYFKAQVDKIKL
jgi:hypothetical protein